MGSKKRKLKSTTKLVKPPGTVYFHSKRKHRTDSPTANQKLELPLDENSEAFKRLYDQDNIIHLLNCDANECRDFLSAVIRFRQNNLPANGQSLHHPNKFFFYFCALDRACLNLLAELSSSSSSNRFCLAYGTRIVTFRNVIDLLDCLTELKLRKATQNYFPPEPIDILPLLHGRRMDTKWMNARYGTKQPKTSSFIPRLTRSKILEYTPKYIEVDEVYKRFIELNFDNLVTKVRTTTTVSPGELLVSSAINNQKEETTLSKPGGFHLDIRKSKSHLSSFMAIALQVPTLTELECYGGDMDAISEEITNVLTVRSNSSEPLAIFVDIETENYDSTNRFRSSPTLLKMFIEKKLRNMTVHLEAGKDFDVLYDVESIMLESAHVQSLNFLLQYPDYNIIPSLGDWLDEWGRMLPKLPKLFTVDVGFIEQNNGNFDSFWENAIKDKASHFSNFSMYGVNHPGLLVLTELLSTRFVAARSHSPIGMLSMDIFRKLKEFLFPKREKKQTDSDGNDGFDVHMYPDDDDDDDDDDEY